jgi:hypothetical protein
LVHFGVCISIIQGARKTAQDKLFVCGDLEYTIHSSFLFFCSLEQVVASMVGIWLLSTGFDWEHASVLAGLCYLVGMIAALAAGYIGAGISGSHLISNSDDLVCSPLK